MLDWFVSWSKTRQPWAILCLTAIALVLSALSFQYILGHVPCVKCIYQRTAVIVIAISAALPLFSTHLIVRTIALLLWGYAAFEGLTIAQDHVEVITANNPFIAPCPAFPNFPEFLPLHQILPIIFDGPGDCADDSWQFLSMGMAEWMRIIFSMYLITAILVGLSYILKFRKAL